MGLGWQGQKVLDHQYRASSFGGDGMSSIAQCKALQTAHPTGPEDETCACTSAANQRRLSSTYNKHRVNWYNRASVMA
jgi:hypothetical protein